MNDKIFTLAAFLHNYLGQHQGQRKGYTNRVEVMDILPLNHINYRY